KKYLYKFIYKRSEILINTSCIEVVTFSTIITQPILKHTVFLITTFLIHVLQFTSNFSVFIDSEAEGTGKIWWFFEWLRNGFRKLQNLCLICYRDLLLLKHMMAMRDNSFIIMFRENAGIYEWIRMNGM
ncbi:hypothetical protein ACJX0J_011736, partial [Zea mays]